MIGWVREYSCPERSAAAKRRRSSSASCWRGVVMRIAWAAPIVPCARSPGGCAPRSGPRGCRTPPPPRGRQSPPGVPIRASACAAAARRRGRASRRPPFAAVERRFQGRHAFGIPGRAERFDGAHVDRAELPAMVEVIEDVGEERCRPIVADEGQRLHDHLARLVGAGEERLLEHLVGGFGADPQDGADRLALHLLLVVVQQPGELGERFAAAELAKQVDRRAAHGGVRRVLEALDFAAGRSLRTQSGST